MEEPEQRLLRSVEEFWRTLREAGPALVRDTECSRSTATLVRILATRTRLGRSTQVSDVAHALRVDMSVASRQVSQLVEDGLVERTVDTEDRRARALRLTPLGLDRADAVEARLLERTLELFADWSPVEVAEATDLLQRLTTTLDRAAHPDPEPALTQPALT
ncbi:MarR family winged helix-turn-helix transcriptional regulator [Cellulomonas fulva]|uniref:MarR family winged helix-turn-helix transcriptional regulator n=1 Tax=Cellulomonas fulva TaxID=2835530 RepID=UPI0027DD8564|nr:MarR family transcriptional regulator [Cellulomonas fulva]